MALLGIPWLASVLGSGVIALVSFFGKFFTKRIAITAAAIVAVTALTAAFIGVIEGLLAGIQVAMPTLGNWYVFLPGNFSSCISVIVTAEVARWVYDWNVRIIQWKLF